MHYLLKQAFYSGAQQALEELGLPGIDLDALLRESQESLSNAGGQSQDADSVAERAVGNSASGAYNVVGSML